MNSAYRSSNDVAVASRCLAKGPGVYDDGVFTSERTTTTGTVSTSFQHLIKIIGKIVCIELPDSTIVSILLARSTEEPRTKPNSERTLSTLRTNQAYVWLDGTVDKGKAMHAADAMVAEITASQAGDRATQVSPWLRK